MKRSIVAVILIFFPALALPQGNVAVVQGVPITEQELNKAAGAELEQLELQHLQAEAAFQNNRQQVRETALNRLIEDRLFALEAARLNISRAELLSREVDSKVQDPADTEIDSLYEANKARINLPKEQVRLQILQYLRQQRQAKLRADLVERLKPVYHVTVSLEPHRVQVSPAGRPARGGSAPLVTLVEFSDFQCDFCRNFNATLNKVLSDYGDKVQLVFRHFPLAEIHPLAFKAAEASMCAFDQGKFWEMHNAMFAAPVKLGPDDLKSKAAAIGLDAAAFSQCLDSGRHAAAIRQDIQDGARSGVAGTPAVFINGRLMTGVKPYPEIARMVEEELQRATRHP